MGSGVGTFKERAVRWIRWHTTSRTQETARNGDLKTSELFSEKVGQVDHFDIGMMSMAVTPVETSSVWQRHSCMKDVVALGSGSKTKAKEIAKSTTDIREAEQGMVKLQIPNCKTQILRVMEELALLSSRRNVARRRRHASESADEQIDFGECVEAEEGHNNICCTTEDTKAL